MPWSETAPVKCMTMAMLATTEYGPKRLRTIQSTTPETILAVWLQVNPHEHSLTGHPTTSDMAAQGSSDANATGRVS
jgi:hypothetical protein